MSSEKCWEYMMCPESKRSECPAYPTYGGMCWLVAGTLCNGNNAPQGYFAGKILDCKECPWYKHLSRHHEDKKASAK